MKILSLFLFLTVCMVRVYSQSTLPLRADTVTIEKVGGNENLKLKDSSRNTVGGILTNIGGGVYTGKKPVVKMDTLIVGTDTFVMRNFANTDLTLNGNRTHTGGGNNITFTGFPQFNILGRARIDSTLSLYNVTGPPSTYNVLVHGLTDSGTYQVPLTSIDQNFAHNDLTFNGNRTHNANGNSFALNNMNGMQLHSTGTAFTRTQYGLFRTIPSNFSFPLTIQYGMLREDGLADSATSNTTYRYGDILSSVTLTDGTGTNTSYHRITNSVINIKPVTDLNIKATANDGTGIDSVFVPGPIIASGGSDIIGTNPIYKVPLSALSAATPTWQQTLTAGSTLNTDNTVTMDGTNFKTQTTTSDDVHLYSHFKDNSNEIIFVGKEDQASQDSVMFRVDPTVTQAVQMVGRSNSTGIQSVTTTSAAGFTSCGTSYVNGSYSKESNFYIDTTYVRLRSANNESSVINGQEFRLYKDSAVFLPYESTEQLYLKLNDLPVSTSSTDSALYITSENRVVKKAQPQRFSQTATATVANTTTETTLLSTGVGSLVITPDKWVVGATYRIKVHGILGTDAANPGTSNFRLKLGSTTIATTGGIFQGTNISGRNFEITTDFVCRSTGATGTVMTMGFYQDRNGSGNRMDDSGSGTPTTIDMTTNQTVDFTLQWSQAAAGNTCSVYIVYFERLNDVF